MKKTLFALLAFIALPAVAAPQTDWRQMCMKNLPGMITIDPSVAEVNFVKSAGKDSFVNFADMGEPDLGYTQDYQNNACLARVYLYDKGLDRFSHKVVDYEARSGLRLGLYQQSTEMIGNNAFSFIEGAKGDWGNIVMVGNYHNNFLKIQTVCMLPTSLSKKPNTNTLRSHTVKMVSEIVRSLDSCAK